VSSSWILCFVLVEIFEVLVRLKVFRFHHNLALVDGRERESLTPPCAPSSAISICESEYPKRDAKLN
jgi:hypothetical protein